MKKKKLKLVGLFILVILVCIIGIPLCFLNKESKEKIRVGKKEVEDEAKITYICDEAFIKSAYGFDVDAIEAVLDAQDSLGDNLSITVTGIPSTVSFYITTEDAEINANGDLALGEINFGGPLQGTITAPATTGTYTGTISRNSILYKTVNKKVVETGFEEQDLMVGFVLNEAKSQKIDDTTYYSCAAGKGAGVTTVDAILTDTSTGNQYYNSDLCSSSISAYPDFANAIPYCSVAVDFTAAEVNSYMSRLERINNIYQKAKQPPLEFTNLEDEGYTKVDDPNVKQTLSCPAFEDNRIFVDDNDNDDSDYEDNLYAKQDKFYSEKVTYSNNYCKTVCQEAVTVSYQAPVATQAGICFSYKVDIQSTVQCKAEVDFSKKPELSQYSKCNAQSVCTHWGGAKGMRGGPNDDFDACVVACDGGEYTQECIDSCDSEVYGDDDSEELLETALDEDYFQESPVMFTANTSIYTPHVMQLAQAKTNEIPVEGVKCNRTFQGPRPIYLTDSGSKYTAEQIYRFRQKNPGGYYAQAGNGSWYWQPAGYCPSSVGYIYYSTLYQTKRTMKRFRVVYNSTKADGTIDRSNWHGGGRPMENKDGFQVVRIRNTYSSDLNAELTPDNVYYDCHSTCKWKPKSMTGCNGQNAILTKYDEMHDYMAALDTWANELEKCLSQAQCDTKETKTTTFTITVDKDNPSSPNYQVYNATLNKDGGVVSGSEPIVEHSGGVCYNNLKEQDDWGTELKYHNVVSFPQRWLSVKNGLTLTNIQHENEKYYQYLGNTFCPKLKTDYVNVKWYKWNVDEYSRYLSEEEQDNFFNEEPRKDNINVHIGSSAGNYWGLLGWNIDINCFYAVGCPEGDCPPTKETPPPDTDCPEPPCPPVTKKEDPMPTFEFRTIALTEMFPNRAAHFNWTRSATNLDNSSYPIQPEQLISSIQNKGSFNDTTDLDYEFDLKADTLKAIKSDNQRINGNYTDYEISSSISSIPGVTVYKSAFLDWLGSSVVKRRGVLGCNNQNGSTCSS